jgi:hypothetical protein
LPASVFVGVAAYCVVQTEAQAAAIFSQSA